LACTISIVNLCTSKQHKSSYFPTAHSPNLPK
jgi:hypothetical protein